MDGELSPTSLNEDPPRGASSDGSGGSTVTPHSEPSRRSWPLYAWVILAVLLAIPCGMALGADAGVIRGCPVWVVKLIGVFAATLELIPKMIMRALGAMAAPLVMLAILSAIVTNEIKGRQGARMMGYYLANTLIAMVIGLSLTNLIAPGVGASLGGLKAEGTSSSSADAAAVASSSPTTISIIDTVLGPPAKLSPPTPRKASDLILELIPRSLGEALAQNNIAQLVVVTLALGIGLIQISNSQKIHGLKTHEAVVDLITVGFELFMKVLLWIVAVVPLAVFGIVAVSVAREGFGLFLKLGWFIVAVLVGILCQITWYLVLMIVVARMSPRRFLAGASNVMAGTFSTASTAATMPITLRALTEKLGISRASSQLAACVGTNFNNDGTALYQAGAALFFAQALNVPLGLSDQIIIVLTTLVASIGAGGIPSGSFVTLPLIFAAVGLPAESIPILLTIDWFLDRCRTTSNVLGDMTVAVLLDHHEQASEG